MNIINLTPHKICIINKDRSTKTINPSGQVARVDVHYDLVDHSHGIDFYNSVFGDVKDLPDKKKDVFLIVSRVVAQAAPDRDDLLIPGQLVRDDDGRPSGCRGLVVPNVDKLN